ncbi:hypothetical protein LTR17_014390 [Elasticomyces elasticus]|nr:hypothetical protein LTR17_014390 [Elasticomyces elasticus]
MDLSRTSSLFTKVCYASKGTRQARSWFDKNSKRPEDGGLRAYASIRRNEEAAWLKDSLETEFMCEVSKDASPGNEVLFTEHCKCALLLRPLDGKVWQYTGWVYDFPFLSKYQRGLRQEKLIQGAAFDDFDIL